MTKYMFLIAVERGDVQHADERHAACLHGMRGDDRRSTQLAADAVYSAGRGETPLHRNNLYDASLHKVPGSRAPAAV